MAASFTFSRLPKEVRFHVYKALAAGPNPPELVLQRWFEKMDIEEQIARLQAVDPVTTYRPLYNSDVLLSDEDDAQHLQEEVDEDDDNEMSSDGSEDDGSEGEDEDEEDYDIYGETSDEEDENEEEHEAENGEVNSDAEEDTGSEGADEVMTDAEVDATNTDTVTAGAETGTTTAPTQQAPPVRYIRAHHKWRHVPRFLRISHCPPPKELMLLSRDLAAEIKDWFYDVAVVHIDATGSFAHTSMLDEILGQIEGAAVSPFKSVRKVEISFVYDSQWVRGPDSRGNESFFQQILLMRANKIVEFLLACVPQLKKVQINWHDTVFDDISASFQYHALESFDILPANVVVEQKEHFLTPGKQPHRKSLLGKKRLEFQHIADTGFRFN
ncbi:uncharacterized protein EI97DRAFT_430886 [Westerdykella ornata]|uniref:Uncharacterized protein n=1 Tax=Westerdykella ornata TaxID=318751 RepID=A0A6A6JQS1_WESOR|nr:uncharacterized protein EI97DRAFT_430886 [Westerdykella ornata]KAF2278615.1 hypothetical protein EI97DRAFT_430886 [Westerdykella ornata]